MPATVGYPKERIRRSQENLDLLVRARELTSAAKAYRRTKREQAWDRSEKQWSGDRQVGGDELSAGNHDRVNVNVSFSTINTILPYVTGSDPSFVVEPYGGAATVEAGRQLQALLNRLWRSNRLAGNRHLRRAAWDFLVLGDGYLKVSYTLDEVIKAKSAETATVANLWVDRLDPRDVWIDPSADGTHNARYLIVRLFRSVQQLQEDKRYSNTRGLEANDDRIMEATSDRREQVALGAPTSDPADKIVSIYEFYDIPNRKMVVYTEQSDLPLQVVDEIDCPIVQVANHIIPNSPYHMGELEQIDSLQDEINKTRTQMVEHRRRNAQKWLVRKGDLTDEAKSALQSQDVNSVVEVAGDRSLEDMVAPLMVPNLTADSYAIDQLIKADVYEITGVNEYLRGGEQSIRRTATEATILEGVTNVKTTAKLRVIENAARQVGQLLLDIASAVYPLTDADEMAMILTGRDAQALAGSADPPADPNMVMGGRLIPTPDIFDGTYEVFVEQGSTELRNPVVAEQKYKEMFLTLSQAIPTLMQMGVQVNLRKVIELWLEAAGVDDVDAILSSSPPVPGQPPTGPGDLGAQLMAGMGGAGPPQGMGMPNLGAAQPPVALPAPDNSGMLPPIS
jgi:hypothetical protein